MTKKMFPHFHTNELYIYFNRFMNYLNTYWSHYCSLPVEYWKERKYNINIDILK